MRYEDPYANALEEIIEDVEIYFFEEEDKKEEAEALLKELFQGARLRLGPKGCFFEKDKEKVFEKHQYQEFIKYMKSVNYDAGYGSQNFFGFILLNDNSWFERHEYDGSECWVHKKQPNLNNKL